MGLLFVLQAFDLLTLLCNHCNFTEYAKTIKLVHCQIIVEIIVGTFFYRNAGLILNIN